MDNSRYIFARVEILKKCCGDRLNVVAYTYDEVFDCHCYSHVVFLFNNSYTG